MNIGLYISKHMTSFACAHINSSLLPRALDYPICLALGAIVGLGCRENSYLAHHYIYSGSITALSPLLSYSLGARGKTLAMITRLACFILFGIITRYVVSEKLQLDKLGFKLLHSGDSQFSELNPKEYYRGEYSSFEDGALEANKYIMVNAGGVLLKYESASEEDIVSQENRLKGMGFSPWEEV